MQKVRNYIEIISPIFRFDVAEKVRNPRKGRIARIREKSNKLLSLNLQLTSILHALLKMIELKLDKQKLKCVKKQQPVLNPLA